MLDVNAPSGTEVGATREADLVSNIKSTPRDRRRHSRYKIAGLACSVYMLGIESHAVVCDMSVEGANIILPSHVAPLTCSLVISMRLPGSGIAIAEALIRSFARLPTGYSLHVAFGFPDPAHRERLRRYLTTI